MVQEMGSFIDIVEFVDDYRLYFKESPLQEVEWPMKLKIKVLIWFFSRCQNAVVISEDTMEQYPDKGQTV